MQLNLDDYTPRKEQRIRLLEDLFYGDPSIPGHEKNVVRKGRVFGVEKRGEHFVVPGWGYMSKPIIVDCAFELFEIEYDPLIELVDDFDIISFIEYDEDGASLSSEVKAEIASSIRELITQAEARGQSKGSGS